jgi:acetate kinase
MIHDYLQRVKGWSLEKITHVLNTESGLKGLCGSNDMRTVAELAAQDDKHAQLAREMVAYRIKKYIGAYTATLGRVDAIIFSGGIGEHDAQLRSMCCLNLEILGVKIDSGKNFFPADYNGKIHDTNAKVAVLVIPTNEELAIALCACLHCEKQENKLSH